MSLAERFFEVVSKNPSAPVLIENDREISRQELADRASVLAAAFIAQGVTEGDFVGLSLANNSDHLAAMLALSRVGAASVPFNARGERAHGLARRFGIKLVCVDHGNLTDSGLISVDISKVNLVSHEELKAVSSLRWPADDLPARIGMTSGTTGEPNAILYSQAFWVERIETTVEDCDSNTRTIVANLQLTMGNLGVFAAVLAGGVAIFSELHNPRAFFHTVRRYGVTHAITMPGSITTMAALNEYNGVAFPTMKYLRVIGGAFEPALVELAAAKLTPNVYHPYGLSEVGAISMADLQMLREDPEFAGVLKPGCRARVRDADGKVLESGETGIIEVSVPGMPERYFDNEAATKLKFNDGWFITGDIGMVRADGAIRIDGRSDHKINIAGRKVQPERVESALLKHPEVVEAAVFAAELGGKRVIFGAVVPNHKGPLKLPLKRFCLRMRLGSQAPDRFVLVDKLPKNEAGKLLRRELEQQLLNWMGGARD